MNNTIQNTIKKCKIRIRYDEIFINTIRIRYRIVFVFVLRRKTLVGTYAILNIVYIPNFFLQFYIDKDTVKIIFIVEGYVDEKG